MWDCCKMEKGLPDMQSFPPTLPLTPHEQMFPKQTCTFAGSLL